MCTRRSDEPKLELGDVVSIKEGVVGVVVARYVPSGDERQDISLRTGVEAHWEPVNLTWSDLPGCGSTLRI